MTGARHAACNWTEFLEFRGWLSFYAGWCVSGLRVYLARDPSRIVPPADCSSPTSCGLIASNRLTRGGGQSRCT